MSKLDEIREHARVHGSIPQQHTEWVLSELRRAEQLRRWFKVSDGELARIEAVFAAEEGQK
jgi:hypothetical protein